MGSREGESLRKGLREEGEGSLTSKTDYILIISMHIYFTNLEVKE